MVWWQILFIAFSGYCVGISYGRNNPVDSKSLDKVARMQDQLDLAYEKVDHVKRLWIEAEQRAETWERRYDSLVENQKEKI